VRLSDVYRRRRKRRSRVWCESLYRFNVSDRIRGCVRPPKPQATERQHHFGVDVEEGFTLASLIMRNSDLFLADQKRFRLLVFGFSQFLTLRDRPIYDVGFEVLVV
jgi:hypothetical protein